MKLKKSDINLLIMLVGVAIGVLSYFFVYTKFNEKTDILNVENAALEQEVNYLQDLADHKQEYIDKTESMQAEIDEIKAQFPAEYKPEDDILYIRAIEKDYDAFASSLGMGVPGVIEVQAPVEAAPVAVATEESVDGEETEAAPVAETAAAPTPEIQLYRVSLTTNMVTNYNSIKDIVQMINTDPNRKSIEQLSLAFDSETGDIAANMSFSAYSLSGTEKVYIEPDFGDIRFGTGNIFNSAEKKKEIEAEKAAKEAAEENDDEE